MIHFIELSFPGKFEKWAISFPDAMEIIEKHIFQLYLQLMMRTKLYEEKKRLRWQKLVLLSILGYEGAGALAGGALLTFAPDGRLLHMPVEIMHGVFTDFLIPGIILFLLGILNIVGFFKVLQSTKTGWIWAGLATGGLTIWFWIEIAILEELHWLHAMWGLPVIAAGITMLPFIPRNLLQRGLLLCGILSSLLYVAINIIVPFRWPNYSIVSQAVSELSAIGSPTRMLWNVLAAPYSLLIVAFGIGIRNAPGENRRLRLAGSLLIAYGSLGILWPFAPMHLRETLAAGGSTISDTLHIALGIVTELLYLTVLALTAMATGKFMRSYSVFTFFVLLVFGFFTFREAPGIATNQSTPLIGIWERVNIGVFMVWMIIFSIYLLKRRYQ